MNELWIVGPELEPPGSELCLNVLHNQVDGHLILASPEQNIHTQMFLTSQQIYCTVQYSVVYIAHEVEWRGYIGFSFGTEKKGTKINKEGCVANQRDRQVLKVEGSKGKGGWVEGWVAK